MASTNSQEQLSWWELYLEQHNENDNQESLNETIERYSNDINELNFSIEQVPNNASEETVWLMMVYIMEVNITNIL